MNLGLAVLLFVIATAATSDLWSRRIPNILVIPSCIFAIFFHSFSPEGYGILDSTGGSIGLLSAVTGLIVGLAALFPLYLLRAMGAGDVKLMMMVGAFLGPLQTLGVVVLTFAAGGVLAIAMALSPAIEGLSG